jgi:hypothetical protein
MSRLSMGRSIIRTWADAQTAAREVLAINLDTLPVGFPVDPLSRDAIRDREERLGDWISDTPLQSSDAYYKQYDAYVAAPSVEGLSALKEMILAENKPRSPIEQLSRLKAAALLEYQHFLRTGKRAPSEGSSAIWEVGDFAREHGPNGTAGEMPLGSMAVSWMWAAWIADPSMYQVSLNKLARNGHYFTETLRPYPLHNLLVVTRRILEDQRRTGTFQPDFGALVNDGALKRYQPKDGRQPLFQKWCANLLMLSCLTIADDLKHGRTLPNPTGALQQLRALRDFTGSQDPAIHRTLLRLVPLAKKQQGD